jgi:hypothetical protein
MAHEAVHNVVKTPASIPDGPTVQWQWRSLSNFQIHHYGKHIAKLELTRLGLDVYPATVDNHGIDLVVRSRDGKRYADIQVKTLRRWSNYFFITDDKFPPKDNIYLALVLFPEGLAPKYCLLPRAAWGEGHPKYLVHHDYFGLKSRPECGINMRAGVMEAIVRDYSMDAVAALLK